MDQAGLMHLPQGIHQCKDHLDRHGIIDPAAGLFDIGPQRHAIQIFHDHVGRSLILEKSLYLYDIRIIPESRHILRFLKEPPDPLQIICSALSHHDGNIQILPPRNDTGRKVLLNGNHRLLQHIIGSICNSETTHTDGCIDPVSSLKDRIRRKSHSHDGSAVLHAVLL